MIIPLQHYSLKIEPTDYDTVVIKLHDGIEIIALSEISKTDYYEGANADKASDRVKDNG